MFSRLRATLRSLSLASVPMHSDNSGYMTMPRPNSSFGNFRYAQPVIYNITNSFMPLYGTSPHRLQNDKIIKNQVMRVASSVPFLSLPLLPRLLVLLQSFLV